MPDAVTDTEAGTETDADADAGAGADADAGADAGAGAETGAAQLAQPTAKRPTQSAAAVHMALCVATIFFACAFVYPMYTPQAVPWYYPLEWRWAWEIQPGGMAMDFFGRLLLACGAAAPAGVLAHVLGRRAWVPGDRGANLLTAWAVAATVLVMLHFAWHLYLRVPTPEPLPDWYVPR